MAIAFTIFTSVLTCYALFRCWQESKNAEKVIIPEPNVGNIKSGALVSYLDGARTFSFELLHRLIKEYPKDNHIISPLSISFLLSMIKHGVGLKEREEIEKIIHLPQNQDNLNVICFQLIKKLKEEGVDIAGLLYLNDKYRLDPEYKALVSMYYRSLVKSGSSAAEVNQWVTKTTHGNIKDIIQQNDLLNFFLVLANAIHFKGKWEEPFKVENTSFCPFQTTTQSIQVPTMHRTFETGYFEDSHCKAVKLSYEGHNKMSMVLILPHISNDFSFIDHSSFEAIRKGVESQTMKIKLALPKFKLNDEIDVKDLLTKMGMAHLMQEDPDFFDMVDLTHPPTKAILPSLRISKVCQKAVLEVDEEGMKAAAVSVAVVTEKCAPPSKPKIIDFDRPFFAALVYEDLPIMCGVIGDPSKN